MQLYDHQRHLKANAADNVEQPSGESMDDFSGSIFEEMLQLYEHLEKEMLTSMINYVWDDVKARSKSYRKAKVHAGVILVIFKRLYLQWHCLSFGPGGPSGLSTAACDMFLVLRDHLHGLQTSLSRSLFERLWQAQATNLNSFLFHEVVLHNKFRQVACDVINPSCNGSLCSDGGGAQLYYDIKRNLLPLFNQYTPRPEGWFRDLKEACSLLTIPEGTARLLKAYCLIRENKGGLSAMFTGSSACFSPRERPPRCRFYDRPSSHARRNWYQ